MKDSIALVILMLIIGIISNAPSCEPKRGNNSQKIIDNHGKDFLKNVQGEFYKTFYDKYKKVADFFNNGQYEK